MKHYRMTKATKHSFHVKTAPLGGKHLASLRLKLFKRERELATEGTVEGRNMDRRCVLGTPLRC
jgi:hypothetical protein